MPEARYVSQMVLFPYIEVPKADTMPLAAGHKGKMKIAGRLVEGNDSPVCRWHRQAGIRQGTGFLKSPGGRGARISVDHRRHVKE
jgi:hypothetical protein